MPLCQTTWIYLKILLGLQEISCCQRICEYHLQDQLVDLFVESPGRKPDRLLLMRLREYKCLYIMLKDNFLKDFPTNRQ